MTITFKRNNTDIGRINSLMDKVLLNIQTITGWLTLCDSIFISCTMDETESAKAKLLSLAAKAEFPLVDADDSPIEPKEIPSTYKNNVSYVMNREPIADSDDNIDAVLDMLAQ